MPKTSVVMNSPAFRIERSTCVSAAKCTTISDACDERRGDRGIGDVALDERVARMIDDVLQVLEPARVGQLVERGDLPVACVASAWRTKFEPMNPAPPVTSTLTICVCYRPVWPPKAPKKFENVPMPASVNDRLNRWSCGTTKLDDAAEIVGLVLDSDAAALRVVEGHDALLPEVVVAQVVVERVGAAQVVARIVDRRGGVEVVVGERRVVEPGARE